MFWEQLTGIGIFILCGRERESGWENNSGRRVSLRDVGLGVTEVWKEQAWSFGEGRGRSSQFGKCLRDQKIKFVKNGCKSESGYGGTSLGGTQKHERRKEKKSGQDVWESGKGYGMTHLRGTAEILREWWTRSVWLFCFVCQTRLSLVLFTVSNKICL